MLRSFLASKLVLLLLCNSPVAVVALSVTGAVTMGVRIAAQEESYKTHEHPPDHMTSIETQFEDHLEHEDDRLDRMETIRDQRHDDNTKFQEDTRHDLGQLHDILKDETAARMGDEKIAFGFMAAISLAGSIGWLKKFLPEARRHPHDVELD